VSRPCATKRGRYQPLFTRRVELSPPLDSFFPSPPGLFSILLPLDYSSVSRCRIFCSARLSLTSPGPGYRPLPPISATLDPLPPFFFYTFIPVLIAEVCSSLLIVPPRRLSSEWAAPKPLCGFVPGVRRDSPYPRTVVHMIFFFFSPDFFSRKDCSSDRLFLDPVLFPEYFSYKNCEFPSPHQSLLQELIPRFLSSRRSYPFIRLRSFFLELHFGFVAAQFAYERPPRPPFVLFCDCRVNSWQCFVHHVRCRLAP